LCTPTESRSSFTPPALRPKWSLTRFLLPLPFAGGTLPFSLPRSILSRSLSSGLCLFFFFHGLTFFSSIVFFLPVRPPTREINCSNTFPATALLGVHALWFRDVSLPLSDSVSLAPNKWLIPFLRSADGHTSSRLPREPTEPFLDLSHALPASFDTSCKLSPFSIVALPGTLLLSISTRVLILPPSALPH